MKQFKLIVKSICSVLLLWVFFSGPAVAQTITEIIDATGDGAGNPLDAANSIAVDGSGNVYVTGGGTDNAFKITPGGVITEIIDLTGDGAGNTLDAAVGIAVDGSGNVYVTGFWSDNAFKITPGGVITGIIDATGDGTGNPLTQPTGIAVDGAGNVYVTGRGSYNAFKITPGGVMTEIIDATGDGAGNLLGSPQRIAVDGSGNVYVAGLRYDNAFKITPGGVITEIIDATGDGAGNSLNYPNDIAVDGIGNVYVTGGNSTNAFKITPGGLITEIIDGTGEGASNPLQRAIGIAVDGSGNVYVTGQLSDNAFKITPGGVITEIIDATGDGTGNLLDYTNDIAVDGSRNVYVIGATSNNAFKIAFDFAEITVDPTSYDYGSVEVGSSSTKEFEITNTGTADLDISSFTLVGVNSSEFTIISGGDPVSILPSESHYIEISFDPATAPLSVKTAELEIVSNAVNNALVSVPLSGYGIPSLHSPYLFLADEEIEIERRITSTTGDMHSNDEIKFKKGSPSTHTGNITAVGEIEIKKDNTIIGDIESGEEIEVEGNSVITGTVTEYSDVTVIPLPTLSFTAGGDDITVEQNQSLVLAPGSYNKVKVKKNAQLYLSTGNYYFEELKLDKEALLSVDIEGGPTEINVVKKLEFKKKTEVEITPLGDEGSRYLTFNYLDDDEIKFEKESKILGSFITPDSEVEMKKEVIFIGSICAKEIKIDKDTDFNFHSLPFNLAKGSDIKSTKDEQNVPLENFILSQNYPNPFNPSTTISYQVADNGYVTLKVYDVLGNEVATLVSERKEEGSYQVMFDASALSSGVYIYQMRVNDFLDTKKMILMK